MVENDVNKIKINAQLDDSSATVTGIGEVEVKEELFEISSYIFYQNQKSIRIDLNKHS